ncbi:hypothetical protein QVD17_22010 [Tagetes erecta]|uniref:Protein E6 n=1 Tax=Tagetes erecta TaxID=13708 RepID=A0AAD8KFM4_TARER|nr:hypothetical protein QVD17_22010 [Tagetes erecta]
MREIISHCYINQEHIHTIQEQTHKINYPQMATNNIVFFFFFITLTLSSTIHARDSQFFNKFSTNIPQPLNTNPQQQPEFIPQSQDSNSYGLYGKLPPSTTTTTTTTTNNNNNLPSYLPENYNPVAYTTPIHSNTQADNIPNEYKLDPQPSYNNNYNGQNRMYNSEKQEEYMGTNNMYNSEKQGFDDASFMETMEDDGNMYNSEKQVENGRYNSQRQVNMGDTRYSTSNNGNMYNNEKQGMSDTRFLENGKYYYDVNMENVNSNANMNTRRYNSRNEYNTQGYYGNNENSYDRYKYNSYSNGGAGYQDEEDQFNP